VSRPARLSARYPTERADDAGPGTVPGVAIPTIRCVVPTRPQPGIELDRGITRQLAERTDRFLGVYADVATAGVVRVGDVVRVERLVPPNAVRRMGFAANKAVMRQAQRLLEATVSRVKS
jgi:hypothetical protein